MIHYFFTEKEVPVVTWAVPAAISAAVEDAGRDDAAAGEAGEAGEAETEQHPQYWDTNPA